LQTHNTIFLGVLHYESTNGFASQQNSSPGVLYFESTRLPKPLKIKVASAFHSVILRAHFVGLTVRSFQQAKMENGLKFLRSIECGWLQ
jgi:hypothetical protein